MTVKFYTSVAKGLKLKVRFFVDNSTFVEVTGEKLVVGLFAPSPSPILKMVKGLVITDSKKDFEP